jgi:transcription elongation factor SPT5
MYGTPRGSTPRDGVGTPRGGNLPGTPVEHGGVTMSPVPSEDYYGGGVGTPGGGTSYSAGGFGGLDAGYTGIFVTNAVVVLPDGRQGVVRRRDAGTVEVSIGSVRVLPNGDSRLDALSAIAAVEVVSEGELSLAMPQKKDRVVVVEGAGRGAGAELIGVDNDEGVMRMDASKDITIQKISTLARVWVG